MGGIKPSFCYIVIDQALAFLFFLFFDSILDALRELVPWRIVVFSKIADWSLQLYLK